MYSHSARSWQTLWFNYWKPYQFAVNLSKEPLPRSASWTGKFIKYQPSQPCCMPQHKTKHFVIQWKPLGNRHRQWHWTIGLQNAAVCFACTVSFHECYFSFTLMLELSQYDKFELDASLSCPGTRDEDCPPWDHTVQLFVCCDSKSPLCNQELGRWITPFRRYAPPLINPFSFQEI